MTDQDNSPYILTLVLIIQIILMCWGFLSWYKFRLDVRLQEVEYLWKTEVLKTKASRCFQDSYSNIYLIGNELQTWYAENKFQECVK